MVAGSLFRRGRLVHAHGHRFTDIGALVVGRVVGGDGDDRRGTGIGRPRFEVGLDQSGDVVRERDALFGGSPSGATSLFRIQQYLHGPVHGVDRMHHSGVHGNPLSEDLKGPVTLAPKAEDGKVVVEGDDPVHA